MKIKEAKRTEGRFISQKVLMYRGLKFRDLQQASFTDSSKS